MSARHIRLLLATLVISTAALFVFLALSGCSGASKPADTAAQNDEKITSDAVAVVAQLTSVGKRTTSTILQVPVMTGETTVLLEVADAIDGVQISTGGGRMSYLESTGKLWMVFGPGARPKQIAEGVTGRGIWAPAKPHLAYVDTAGKDKVPTAHVYDAPQSTYTDLKLGGLSALKCSIAGWYPDGSAILVSAGPSTDTDGGLQLYRVEIATGHVSMIGKSVRFVGFDASGTPVVARWIGGKTTPWRLEFLRPGGTSTPVFEQALPSFGAAVSPDGKQVVFDGLDDVGASQLFLGEPDGLDPRPVTKLVGATDLTPVWSGDNRTVVFSWRDEGGALHMSVCDTPTRVTLDLLAAAEPEGTRLAPAFGVAP